MIQKAIKKPVVVEFVYYSGTSKSAYEVIDFVGSDKIGPLVTSSPSGHIQIRTLEGVMVTAPDSYVVRGVKGEYWAVRGDIFRETYEILKPVVPAPLNEEEIEELNKLIHEEGKCFCKSNTDIINTGQRKRGQMEIEPMYCEKCIPY